jgi:hypothetical protein
LHGRGWRSFYDSIPADHRYHCFFFFFCFWGAGGGGRGKPGHGDLVFFIIIEYSSLRDFWPQGHNRSIFIGLFLKHDILACVWNLRISYRVIIISWRMILVSFRRFFWRLYIFVWWNIWVSIILLLPSDTLFCMYVIGKGAVWHTPCWKSLMLPKVGELASQNRFHIRELSQQQQPVDNTKCEHTLSKWKNPFEKC